MNRRTLFFLIVLFCAGCLTSPLHAERAAWKLDKAHTNFYFSVDHIFAKVQGRFTEYDGTILFDPDDLKGSKFSFEIKVKSVDTGSNKRDRHLRSADFFDESNYPRITFSSTEITAGEENLYMVRGLLTIKDISQLIVLPLHFEGIRDNPLASDLKVAGFNGRLTLDRLTYKVGGGKYYKMGAVGKDVDILVTIEALRKRE